MKHFYLSFDDTDTLESPGTGHVLEAFLRSLPCESSFISRHQLFVSRDVPYTSHNSAMCAELWGEIDEQTLIGLAAAHLLKTFAPGADPGLCVADAERMRSPELLVRWGYRAKKEVLTKADAYALASACGVHLSEHGGTGQGVVGALAAVGLRFGGQDGRVKGRMPVSRRVLTVAELLRETGFGRVFAYGEGTLPGEAFVEAAGERVKAVYLDRQATVLAVRDGERYRILDKELLKSY